MPIPGGRLIHVDPEQRETKLIRDRYTRTNELLTILEHILEKQLDGPVVRDHILPHIDIVMKKIALKRCDNVSAAARYLSMKRTTMLEGLKSAGISKDLTQQLLGSDKGE